MIYVIVSLHGASEKSEEDFHVANQNMVKIEFKFKLKKSLFF